jgi:hypothetical protein
MYKVPYDMIAMEADRLVILTIISPQTYLAQYYDFLMACGWTDWEFDLETLRRVDAIWERIYRQNF